LYCVLRYYIDDPDDGVSSLTFERTLQVVV
jgi:hypothetical protein